MPLQSHDPNDGCELLEIGGIRLGDEIRAGARKASDGRNRQEDRGRRQIIESPVRSVEIVR